MHESSESETPAPPAPDEGTGTGEGGTSEGAPSDDAPEGVDYSGSQAEIDAAKQKAHDADAKRLAEESAD